MAYLTGGAVRKLRFLSAKLRFLSSKLRFLSSKLTVRVRTPPTGDALRNTGRRTPEAPAPQVTSAGALGYTPPLCATM